MTRFLLILSCISVLIVSLATVTPAMGVSDFVAVADSPGSALYNPAGLAWLDSSDFLVEHRFSGRDVALGWDDILVYSVAEPNGTGALFLGYSRDRWTNNIYQKYQTLGYAYGWRPKDTIAVGVAAKFTKTGIYSNFTGDMVREASKGSFMVDFGVLFKVTDHTRIGLAIHNIGHSSSIEGMNYQTTVGVAWQRNQLTLSAEIYDLLNEGDSSIEGSLARAGIRLGITPKLKIHAVWEESIDDWNYTGQLVGLEYIMKPVTLAANWYRAEGDYLDEDSLQATLGYRF